MQWIFLLILIIFLLLCMNKVEGFDQDKDSDDKNDDSDDKDDDSDEDSDEDSDKEEKKIVTMDKRDIYVDMCPRDYNIKQIKLREKMSRSNQIPGYTSHITFDAMRRIPDPDKPFPVDPDFFKN